MTRISVDEWAIVMAMATAQRATCPRRSVGCVLLSRQNHVLATGYNGVASGRPHCNEVHKRGMPQEDDIQIVSAVPCTGSTAESGTSLGACQAIHAEQNALLQCANVQDIRACYTTSSPCITCTKLLMNTSCERIIYIDEYPHSEAKSLWLSLGRHWIQI